MIGIILSLAIGSVCAPVEAPHVETDLKALYEQGITYEAFIDQAVRRRQMWLGNHEKGQVPDALLTRARAVPGAWRLLVVAEDWCSDSANTVPYVAHLVEALDNLEMRIIDAKVGRPVMEQYRTPDDRAATPTMVLLNAADAPVGCFIERPAELQAWALENKQKLGERAFLREKFAWYDEDQGLSTLAEIVALMEAAAVGKPGCEAGEGGSG